MPFSVTSPVFILVAPQLGENIGMSMRAMWNFGCRDLRLVSPRAGWSQKAAWDASAGASEVIMSHMQVFETLSESVQDLHYLLASTARRRDLALPIYQPRQAAQNLFDRIGQGQRGGILFGPERSGLDNDAVSMAHAIVEYPTNRQFKSLNLSQAVALFAYEYHLLGNKSEVALADKVMAASLGEIDFFCRQLDSTLAHNGFYHSADMRPTIKRNIRNMFQKMHPSQQDIRTWHGIIKALNKGSQN